MPATASQIVERIDAEKLRRRNTSKRRTVAELSVVEKRAIPELFEMHGPGSTELIAKQFGAQRSEVHSLLLHQLFRRMRRMEAWRAMSFPEGRKPLERQMA